MVRVGPLLLLIHGNSSCRGVFQHQLHGQLAENYRFIAFDLPGHGQSSDAPDPARTYTRPGLAEAAVELLEKLRITQVVVFGWSLGGHIGIEMMHLFPGLLGSDDYRSTSRQPQQYGRRLPCATGDGRSR